ncbi:alpha/beta hydrolase [Roseimicrobium gellanilyticum]|nr:alpha/beta hydrolase [Roseimicrobium gellanilyticum]
MRHLLPALLVLAITCSAHAELKTDIEFAKVGDVSLTLDVHVPDGPGPFPTAILVHGGGFTKGDKTSYITPLFKPLNDAGYTWFTINYRLAPQHRWPACLDDVETAIRWVRAHAAEYKVDVNRIALIGESAGGHLVSMAGTRAQGDTAVAAVVPFYAPHDLFLRAQQRKDVGEGLAGLFGISREVNDTTLAALKQGSPFYHLKAGLPPYLLIHGDKDDKVPFEQSTLFQAASRKVGNTCELITIPGGGHGMGGWKAVPAGATYANEMITWLNKVMVKK